MKALFVFATLGLLVLLAFPASAQTRFSWAEMIQDQDLGSLQEEEKEDEEELERPRRQEGWIPRVRALARVGQLDIDGDLGVNARGIVQTTTSADSLGLDDETSAQPRLDIDWDWLHFSFSGLFVEYEGTGFAETTIDFGNGNGITAGTQVESDIELDMVTGSVYVDILPSWLLDLGIGFGLGVLDVELDFRSLTGPATTVTGDDLLPFGFLSARVSKAIGRFEFTAIGSGAAAEFDDQDLSFYDVDAMATFKILRTRFLDATILGGYRWIGIDYEFSDRGGKAVADVDFEGPYVGFSLNF